LQNKWNFLRLSLLQKIKIIGFDMNDPLAISNDKEILFGNGKEIEKNTFEINDGLTIHFSDEPEMNNIYKRLETIKVEFLLYQKIAAANIACR
jgi:hypothetical protein